MGMIMIRPGGVLEGDLRKLEGETRDFVPT
jgi:hypothetical protein